jgi:hypothetical protein
MFHKKCALDWYQGGLHNNCAYCRRDFNIKDMREHSINIANCSVSRRLREKINRLKMENQSKAEFTQQIKLNEQLKQENFHIRRSLNDSQDVS